MKVGCKSCCGRGTLLFLLQSVGVSEMHKINDMVIYGTEGICRITDITVQDMHGGKVEYYVLKPMGDGNSTIFVPTGNEALASKMRRILSAEEIYALIRTMTGESMEWIENENMRKQRCKEILAEGDRMELVRMIKAIYLHGEERKNMGKKLHLSDERFMKDAEKLLYEEFAHVLNIQKDEVVPFIMEQISVTEKVC